MLVRPNHLFIRVRFDFEDAATSVVRRQGLFVATQTDPELPVGRGPSFSRSVQAFCSCCRTRCHRAPALNARDLRIRCHFLIREAFAIRRYYNLFDPAKHYTQLLFRAGDGHLRSRGSTRIQSTLIHRLQGVADLLSTKDGSIVSGANLRIDADTGLGHPGSRPRLSARRSARGAITSSPCPSRAGVSAIGVRFTTRTVTELETNLREPAAVGVRSYQEPGRAIAGTLAWGWEGAGSDGQPGDFHAVYALDSGLLENRRQRPL